MRQLCTSTDGRSNRFIYLVFTSISYVGLRQISAGILMSVGALNFQTVNASLSIQVWAMSGFNETEIFS
jgi:hypothetical protein